MKDKEARAFEPQRTQRTQRENIKGINGKTQGRKGAKKRGYIFASLRLRVFALMSCFILLGVPGGSAAQSESAITRDNVTRLQPTMSIGRGIAHDAVILADGNAVVAASTGVWMVLIGGGVLQIEQTPIMITRVAMPSDEHVIAAGGEDGSIRLYRNPALSRLVFTAADHLYAITALTFSTDGTRLASGDQSGVVRVWRVEGDQLVVESVETYALPISAIRFEAYGGVLVTLAERIAPQRVVLRVDGTDAFEGFSSPAMGLAIDGDLLTALYPDGTIKAWTWQGLDPMEVDQGWTGSPPDAPVTAVDPITGAVASANNDGSITLTRADGSETRFFGHYRAVSALAFTPDGSILFSGGLDRTIRAFDATITGEAGELASWNVHNGMIHALVVTPTGNALFSAGADGVIRLFGVMDE